MREKRGKRKEDEEIGERRDRERERERGICRKNMVKKRQEKAEIPR